MSKIDNIVKRYDKKGFRLMIVFKTLKTELMDVIEQNHYEASALEYDENEINDLCLEKANEIINEHRDNFTKEDIEELLKKVLSS
jgi:hypothetical protein